MNYTSLISHCDKQSALSRAVIDNFLMNYAAEKEKLPQVIFQQLKKYKHVVAEFEQEHVNRWNAEFIIHHVFKKGGAIRKLLNHAEVKRLPLEHYNYLVEQSLQPWRFSFCFIIDNPADGVFKMGDTMTYEEFTLVSPGIQEMLKTIQPKMWFLLIGYNGKCWQSFGLNIPFRGYTVDDLFFFATELNPRVGDEETLMLEVERNPFPFFMLMCKADVALMESRGFILQTMHATFELDAFNSEKAGEFFDLAWNKDVYRLTSKTLGEFPHYAVAYYNERNHELLTTAMTEFGFATLISELELAGIKVDLAAELCVTPAMFSAVEKVLNRKIKLNPYESYFEKSSPPEQSEAMDKLNDLIGLILPLYNSGEKINITELAKKAGVEPEIAKDLWKKVKKQWDGVRNRK